MPNGFNQFNFDSDIEDGLFDMGFEQPTPIQQQAIPPILEGKDVLGCAQTGTGKTAAFLLPLMQKLLSFETGKVRALIIVPTRELAIQIDNQLQGFSYYVPVSSVPVYGGGSPEVWVKQKKAIANGSDIIIGTPGRLMGHMQADYCDLSGLNFLILDEADRMLDMGFYEDIRRIIDMLPKKRQNLLFSATMPKEIKRLANELLHNPAEINIAISKTAKNVEQQAILSFDENKNDIIRNIFENGDYKKALIFTASKKEINPIISQLKNLKGLSTAGISSDFEQEKREEVLRGFRSERINILVATDILARGIDIDDIELVINYEVPSQAEDYVHRIGRTARASKTGKAVTLVNPRDQRRLNDIEKLISLEIPKVKTPQEIGKSPEWRVGNKKSGKSKGNWKNKKKRN